MSSKVPRREGKGRKPGSFHRNKKAVQYKAKADRAVECGDDTEARVNGVLYRLQLANQERHNRLKVPCQELSPIEVMSRLEEFENGLIPACS